MVPLNESVVQLFSLLYNSYEENMLHFVFPVLNIRCICARMLYSRIHLLLLLFISFELLVPEFYHLVSFYMTVTFFFYP